MSNYSPINGSSARRAVPGAVVLVPTLALALLSGCAAPRTAAPQPATAREEAPAPLTAHVEKPVEAAPPAPERPALLGRVTFLATGDFLPHGAVKQSAKAADVTDAEGRSTNFEGYGALFAPIARDLADADLTFVNLETPVSPSGDEGRPFVFNVPAVALQALKAAGVDLVSFANNHVYDQGRRGFIESLDELEKVDLPYTGAGRTRAEAQKGLRIERNGIRLAVLGASQFFNADETNVDDPAQPHANRIGDGRELIEAVRAARAETDFVIVSMHWGAEYQPQPRATEVELAHRLIEAGADVILGHHPHVLQPIELYRASDGRMGLTIYSLGNFISNQSRFYAHGVSKASIGDTRDAVLFKFAIEKRDYGNGVVRTELGQVSYLPMWTDNDHLSRKKGAPPYIRTVVNAREIRSEQTALDALLESIGDRKPNKDEAREIVRRRKRIELLSNRLERVKARLGEDFLVDPDP